MEGLSGGGAEGYVLALVGGVGGSVSSVLLALSEAVEEAVLEGSSSDLSLALSHVRACWRLGASCPVWESEEVSEALSSLLGRPVSEEELLSAEEALSFVWVDASRRWVALPAWVSAEEALERFVSALESGAVPVRRSWSTVGRASCFVLSSILAGGGIGVLVGRLSCRQGFLSFDAGGGCVGRSVLWWSPASWSVGWLLVAAGAEGVSWCVAMCVASCVASFAICRASCPVCPVVAEGGVVVVLSGGERGVLFLSWPVWSCWRG